MSENEFLKNDVFYKLIRMMKKNKQIEELDRKRATFPEWDKLNKNFIQDLKYHCIKPHIIDYWINKGVDVNFQNNSLRTPLFYFRDYINEFLQYGADVHILDIQDNNCLMYMMKNYCYVNYKPIVEKGIDLFHRNIKNQSIFNITKEKLETSEYISNLQIQYNKEALIYFEEKARKVLKNLLKEYLYNELCDIIILYFNF